MADRKHGDRVIFKRPDGQYDVLRIESVSVPVQEEVTTLEQAREIARGELPDGGTIWYRDYQDPPDKLEPL